MALSLHDRLKNFFETAELGEVFRLEEEEIKETNPIEIPHIDALVKQYILNPAANDFAMTRFPDYTKFHRLTTRPVATLGERMFEAEKKLKDDMSGLKGPQEGIEDNIQVSDEPVPDNPFRPRYSKLSTPQAELHDAIKNQAMALLTTMRDVPAIREQSGLSTSGEEHANIKLAQRHLEDAVYRAVKALTA